MTDRELLKLALKALEVVSLAQPAITALREALDEPVQERLAWMRDGDIVSWNGLSGMGYSGPIYAATPRREWVGLTDEEIYGEGNNHEKVAKDGSGWFDRGSFARAIEAKLKEKNYGA